MNLEQVAKVNALHKTFSCKCFVSVILITYLSVCRKHEYHKKHRRFVGRKYGDWPRNKGRKNACVLIFTVCV